MAINKKGQVTLFIIIAIMLVAVIVILFVFLRRADVEKPDETNPRAYIQSCVKEDVEKSVDVILENGGLISPTRAISYNGKNYTYLCYQADYYLSCYHLYPMLGERIENEIRENIRDEVQNCFNQMKDDYEGRGFAVAGGPTNFSVNLLSGKVRVNLNKRIEISKGGSSQSFEDFSFDFLSPIYELSGIAREIVNSESQYCYFEYNGYMLLYPEYKIWRIDYSESKIYRVIDRGTDKEFKFAVRSCAFPPGI